MKKFKRLLALLLSVGMIITMIPEAAYASGTDGVLAVTDASIALTSGTSTTGNTSETELYTFTPAESGLYVLSMQAEGNYTITSGCNETVYGTEAFSDSADRIMYLDASDQYQFEVSQSGDTAVDYTIQMSGSDSIFSISYTDNGLYESMGDMNLSGMALVINMNSGTSITSTITKEENGINISALNWYNISGNSQLQENALIPMDQITVDDQSDWSFDTLSVGTHTAVIPLTFTDPEDAAGTLTFTITIEFTKVLIENLQVSAPEGRSDVYYIQDDFNFPMDGLTISFTDVSGEHSMVYGSDEYQAYVASCGSDITVTAPDFTDEGDYDLTLSWLGAETSYTVSMADKAKSVQMVFAPYQTSYVASNYATALSLNGLELEITEQDDSTVTYDYGTSEWTTLEQSAYYSIDTTGIEWNTAGEYSCIITYRGVSVTIPVYITGESAPDLASFQVLEKPQQMRTLAKLSSFYENYIYQSVDLYGMELQINYADGSTDNVEVTSHGADFKVSGETAVSITGTYATQLDEDGNTSYYWLISCNGSSEQLTFSSDSILDVESSTIQTGVNYLTTIDTISGYQLYKFVPEETAVYEFYSLGDSDTYGYLYDSDANQITSNDDTYDTNFAINTTLYQGHTYYYLVRYYNQEATGSFYCRLRKLSDTPEDPTVVNTVSLQVETPVLGEKLSNLDTIQQENADSRYSITKCTWFPADEEAESATAYRLTLVVKPGERYQFDGSSAEINGITADSAYVNSAGNLVITYTFPYTDCVLNFEGIAGYQINGNTAGEGMTQSVVYGSSMHFWYDKTDETAGDLIVKADGNIITPSDDGIYTIDSVTSNMTITAKSADAIAGDGQSKISLYNADTLYDAIIGTVGKTIADNTSDNILPILQDSPDESKPFFYGWYTEDGTRFTEATSLEQGEYNIYAKWGADSFTYSADGFEAEYKVLSMEDSDTVDVQLTKVTAARGAVEMPATLDVSEVSVIQKLGVGVTEAKVISIADGAFADLTDITSVKIPEGVTAIGANAFTGCTSLTKVILPDTIDTIESTAFDSTSDSLVLECSQKLATTQAVRYAGVSVEEIAVIFDDYSADEKEMFLADADTPFILTPVVTVNNTVDEDCEWTWSATSGYDAYFTIEKRDDGTLSITPKQLTDQAYTLTVNYGYYTAEIQLSVVKCSFNQELTDGTDRFKVSVADTVYDGKEQTPKVTVTDSKTQSVLVENTDYTVSYASNISVGTATMEISGIGKYSGSLTESFAIEKSDKTIIADNQTMEIGNGQIHASTVDNATLSYASSDPQVASVDAATGEITAHKAGYAAITITAGKTSNYNASSKIIVLIVQKITGSISGASSSYEKTYGNSSFTLGAAATGGVKLSYSSSNSKVVTVDENGKVTITGAGTATITIQPAASSTYNIASKQVTLKVNAASKSITVKKTSMKKSYGQSAFSLGASVTGGEKITYSSSNKSVATVSTFGRVTITGTGIVTITVGSAASSNYKAATSKTITITVAPKKAVLSSAASTKKSQITVKWKKDSKASGYKIVYSTSSSFKNAKTVYVSSTKVTDKTISKLLSGKKYYVKICSYKTAQGKKIYGDYSSTKLIKIK